MFLQDKQQGKILHFNGGPDPGVELLWVLTQSDRSQIVVDRI